MEVPHIAQDVLQLKRLGLIPNFTTSQVKALEALAVVVDCVSGSTTAADDNTQKIQSALDAAGLLTAAGTHVTVHAPGDVYISRTLEIHSNTKLTTSPGTYLKRAPGRAHNWNMLHNRGGQLQYRANGSTIVGGLLTVSAPGHPFSNGDVVFCNNYLGNSTLNGPKAISGVVPGVSFQFAAAGANPTNTSVQLIDVVRYLPLAGSAFSRAANIVTVVEAGHQRQPGDRVWVDGIPVVAATFNGAYKIRDITAGVSWTYDNSGADEAGTGTAHLLGDRNIAFDLSIDGNTGSYGYVGNPGNAVVIGNCTNTEETIREARFTQGGRVVNHFNVSAVYCPRGVARKNTSVLFQFDSFCDKVRVGYVESEGSLDDTVAWGVTTAGFYTETISPCGPGNMGLLQVDTIFGYSATGLFKLYCAAGYDLGNIEVGRVAGQGGISMSDPNTGVSGGSFKSLKIGTIECVPSSATQIAFGCSGTAIWGSVGDIHIGKLVDNNQAAVNTANGGEALYFAGPVKKITIDNFVGKVARTNSAAIKFQPTVTAGAILHIKSADTTCAVGGFVFLARGGVASEALIVDTWTHRGASNNTGTLVYSDVAGLWSTVHVGTLKGSGIGAICKSNTASQTHNWFFDRIDMDLVSSAFNADVAGTYNITVGTGRFPNVGNNILQFGAAGQTVRFTGNFAFHPAGKVALGGASQSLSINSSTAQFDGNLAGLVPLAGDVFWNTNAAFGTGVGLYGRASAGAWQKVY